MPIEVPKQFDMFSGNAVDNRTRTQKKQDRQHNQPKQSLMFSQHDMAQFGVNTNPILPLSPNTRLTLMQEDPRTEEEIEQHLQLEAEALTFRMFTQAVGVTPQRMRIRLYNALYMQLVINARKKPNVRPPILKPRVVSNP